MNPSKNDFLMKNEDDEDDICHQICIFIGHRVCNFSFQFLFDDDKMVIILKNTFDESSQLYDYATSFCKSL